jgi:hypothetical protein
MSSNEVSPTCGECGAELKEGEKQCSKCGSTTKAYNVVSSVAYGVSVSSKVTHKRKGRGTLVEMIGNRFKRSVNPKLPHGVREDLVIDKEKNEWHHVVKDAKTGEVLHDEHEPLSQHNPQSKKKKNIFKKLLKWFMGIVGAVVVALIVVWITTFLQKPSSPTIVSLPNLNAIENSPNVSTVQVSAIPYFNPPYYNGVTKKITNPNSTTCDITLECKTADGFLFSPMKNDNMTPLYNFPFNFQLDGYYEYHDTMIIYIKDFPAKMFYDITFSVYTNNPDTYRGKEDVTCKVIANQKTK